MSEDGKQRSSRHYMHRVCQNLFSSGNVGSSRDVPVPDDGSVAQNHVKFFYTVTICAVKNVTVASGSSTSINVRGTNMRMLIKAPRSS